MIKLKYKRLNLKIARIVSNTYIYISTIIIHGKNQSLLPKIISKKLEKNSSLFFHNKKPKNRNTNEKIK